MEIKKAIKTEFEDKESFKLLPEIGIKQKVTADNINEIKNVINSNADAFNANSSYFETELETVKNTISDDKILIDLISAKVETNSEDIADLKSLKIFNFMGNYDPTIIYKTGDIVASGDKEYLSLKDNNTNPLTDPVFWLLLGFEIDLSNYYNKEEIDNKDALINTEINNIKTDLSTAQSDINTNKAGINSLSTDKQNKLNAGTGIVIDQQTNTISSTSTGDVTKAYVDAEDLKLSNRIDTEEIKINATIQDVNTLENTTTQLETDVLTNQNLINVLTPKVNKNETDITSIKSDYATKIYVNDATDTLETQIDTLETKANLISEDNGNYTLDVASGKTITVNKLPTPTTDDQAANKKYVDDLVNVKPEYQFNTEYSAGYKIGTDDVYFQIIKKGDPYGAIADIPSSGTLITGVRNFIGIEWGHIRRQHNNFQLYNINAITNSPDQHASIIYQELTAIKYWFNQSMTLTSFKNKPFAAKVLYTK